MFARRAGWDLTRNALSQAVQARRARGLETVDLTDADPTHAGLRTGGDALARVLAEVARDESLRRYEPDPRGPRAAREAIARYHARGGPAIDPDRVVLTAGTSEGYAHLFRLLADPGERVLVPRPGYPLFDFLAGLEGVATGSYALVRRGAGFRVELEALAHDAADPDVRALLAVHAHNPTGAFVHPDDAQALRALCREHELALVSDEVFAESALEPARAGAERLASLFDSRGDAPLHFVLSGASKLLALPQLKLSWIVVGGPPALRDEAASRLEAIADTYLSVSPVLAACLPALLEARPAIEASLRARVRTNRDALAKQVAATPRAELLPVEAGFAGILELGAADGAPDEEALALACVERAGVLAHPGFFFDFEDDGHARLVVSLLAEPERFAAAARELLAVAAEECARAAREARG